MAFYSIGDVAERCGINPVTLRAWQRRYGLLKPQRSEGGHRQFDEEDILRIEEIKNWIKQGTPVSKVKALLDTPTISQSDEKERWHICQEELLSVLRQVSPSKLRAKLQSLTRECTVDELIDHVLFPVRQRLKLDQNTSNIMCSFLDGMLIEHVAMCLYEARRKPGKDALLIAWEVEDRARLWLEAWRLAQASWHIAVLPEPVSSPRPEFFPGQILFVWTGTVLTRRQQELLQHWGEQGYSVNAHQPLDEKTEFLKE